MSENQINIDVRRLNICAGRVQEALHCLEGRWKMMILSQLFVGQALRFSDLERAIPNVSQKMLIQQLRSLESDGIVSRTVYPQVPPKVEYQLTDLGKGLEPVFLAILNWAELRSAEISQVGATQVGCVAKIEGSEKQRSSCPD